LPERFEASIYSFVEKKHARLARRHIRNALRNLDEAPQIEQMLVNVGFPGFEVRQGLFTSNQEDILEKTSARAGLSGVVRYDDRFYVINIWEVQPPRLQQLSEVRGRVIADYQAYLEAKWIQELRKKYQVEIDREELKKLSF